MSLTLAPAVERCPKHKPKPGQTIGTTRAWGCIPCLERDRWEEAVIGLLSTATLKREGLIGWKPRPHLHARALELALPLWQEQQAKLAAAYAKPLPRLKPFVLELGLGDRILNAPTEGYLRAMGESMTGAKEERGANQWGYDGVLCDVWTCGCLTHRYSKHVALGCYGDANRVWPCERHARALTGLNEDGTRRVEPEQDAPHA